MDKKPEMTDMGSDLITRDNSRVMALFKSLDRTFNAVEMMAATYKPPLNGEYYLTDNEE